MKINEYAADVKEYTEVVDAPYNLTSDEEVLDERPMGFVKGGLQKLGAKMLPGSYGKQMQGKVQAGEKANQLYSDFHEFLGQTGYKSTDEALKAFLQQQGINIDVDKILKGVAPTPVAAAPAPAASKGFNVRLPKAAPAPVAESVDPLNQILVLSGRKPKNIINENKSKVLNEAISLNRGALNKIFMQVAQQMARSGNTGSPTAAPGPAPAAPINAPSGSTNAPKVSAPSKDFGGNAPAVTPPSTPQPVAAKVTAPSGNFGGDAPQPAPAAPAAPAAPKATAPTVARTSVAKPGAAAAKAAGAQKQSTQNINDYVKNVSAQINAAQSKPEKIELAKELINFMSDRKGSPEYNNALGSATAVLKKAGLNNMISPLKGGQTASQSPQGIRKPAAATPAQPTSAAPAPAPAEQPAATPPTASAPETGAIKTASDGKQYKFMGRQWAMYNPANGKIGQVAKREIGAELSSGKGTDPAPAAPAPKVEPTTSQETPAQKRTRELGAAGRGLAESRILNRNSYIFIKKVLENTDLTLRDLGYRVSVNESTSNSVTLISR